MKPMSAKELARQLTGISCPVEIPNELYEQARAAGLVIVYGYDDDLMEFEGAIDGELGCRGGRIVWVDSAGLVPDSEDIDKHDKAALLDCLMRKSSSRSIEAMWRDEEGYSWTYSTNIPHETFEVVEDGSPYCRGIVFSLADASPGSADSSGYEQLKRDLFDVLRPAVESGTHCATCRHYFPLSEAEFISRLPGFLLSGAGQTLSQAKKSDVEIMIRNDAELILRRYGLGGRSAETLEQIAETSSWSLSTLAGALRSELIALRAGIEKQRHEWEGIERMPAPDAECCERLMKDYAALRLAAMEVLALAWLLPNGQMPPGLGVALAGLAAVAWRRDESEGC